MAEKTFAQYVSKTVRNDSCGLRCPYELTTLSQLSLPSPEFGISSHSSEVSSHPILGHPKAPPEELVPQSRPEPANRNRSLSISALPYPKMWLIHRWASTFGAQPAHHRPDTSSRPTSRVRFCPCPSLSTIADDSFESTTIRPSFRSLELASVSQPCQTSMPPCRCRTDCFERNQETLRGQNQHGPTF